MPGSGYRKRRIIAQLRLLLMVAIGLSVLAAILASPGRRAQDPAYPQSGYASALTSLTASPTTSASPSPSLSPLSPTPGSTNPPSLLTSQPWATLGASLDQGLILLAMSEGGSSHLFAYHPQGVPFYRLTSGNWDDVSPSVSPDGTRVAFASNRDGFWDLYLLDLTSGETTRLTSSKEYDSAPSWSPDGRWLAYESYLPDNGGGLDIYIRPLDGSAPPIRLTEDPAADFNPAWSPGGRQVAFVSDRSGENEIWLADLNRTEGRFQNLSHNSRNVEDHPAWSPDGSQLVWSAATDSGTHDLYLWRLDAGLDPLARPQVLGDGDWPAWAPDGGSVLAALQTPNQDYLSAYAPSCWQPGPGAHPPAGASDRACLVACRSLRANAANIRLGE